MKPWHLTVLVLCGCVLLLALALVIYRVGDAADRSVETTPGLFSSFSVTLAAVAADTCTTQHRLVAAIEQVSSAAAGAMDRTARASEAAMRRIARRFDRLADGLQGAVDTISCEIPPLLRESTALVRTTRESAIPATVTVLDEAAATLASARGIADQARAELEASGREIRQAVGGVRPMLDATTGLIETGNGIAKQGERGATSAANVAAHYEKMILHPSTGQKIKGWLQLFFSGVTVWANSKILF